MRRKAILVLTMLIGLSVALPSYAQMSDVVEETHHAVVRSVVRDGDRQQLTVELLSGTQEGRSAELDFNGVRLETGDQLFVHRLVTLDGDEYLQIEEVDRRSALLWFTALFMFAVVALGRWQGVRALASLGVSIVAVIGVLVPRILAGGSPVLWATAVAIGILFVSIALTHGRGRTAIAAFLGTAVAVGLTAALATVAVSISKFSGLADDAAFYLDIGTGGAIDLRGLLLAAIIIGAVGVLDDVAITQAAAVKELNDAAPMLTARALFQRALRIGREHVGALVNTLALAYVGAALPLLLLFSHALSPLDQIVNREMIATEIIRALVGSIGVIAAVPLTTWFAVLLIKRRAR
ncbi:MAG: YibE/F family protein [bacterium]|nr:YibE/F family protein [bacterium]